MLQRSPASGSRLSSVASVLLPAQPDDPLRTAGRRLLVALAGLVVMVGLVYVDRGGYHDSAGGSLSLLDAAYYATVSLSTTGYGDITPVTDGARLVNTVLVTPLRLLFLVALVGTTLQTLTEHSRQQIRLNRWRRRLKNPTIVIGYGMTGRSAVRTLIRDGENPKNIVVVDLAADALADATADGVAAVRGDATRTEVLEQAGLSEAKRVVVTANRDDTSVLIVLTVRQVNHAATVVATVRESENIDLLQQSGADGVITSAEAVGRLAGLSALRPSVGLVLEDLLTGGSGLELDERSPTSREVGQRLDATGADVLALCRDGVIYRRTDEGGTVVRDVDRLVLLRSIGAPHGADRLGQ